VPLILASLGLGSATIGQWIPRHKGWFLAIASLMLLLSLFSALRERKRIGKNTGLIIFALALIVTLGLFHTKIASGFFR
jgi:predicted Na+-dependent transporter